MSLSTYTMILMSEAKIQTVHIIFVELTLLSVMTIHFMRGTFQVLKLG